jgi:hypothetical protein
MQRKSQTHAPAARDDSDRRLLADIEQFGWHMIGVGQDDEGPGFVYSIGMYHSFSQPEILVIGLDTKLMFQMVSVLGELVRGGKRFEHLDESDGVLEGFNVAFRTVEPKYYSEYVGYARWYYRGDDFPLLQCVWPVSGRRYPWHPDFPAALAKQQPVLSHDPSWPFHEGKNLACFTTKQVLAGSPILLVSHDEEGDWQFLCGTTNEPSECVLVCLREMLARDGTIAQVADLPAGWMAERPNVGAAWIRAENEQIDDDELNDRGEDDFV